MPVFGLVLHKTYHENGFFNVPVEYDRYVREQEGPISIVIGRSGRTIQGTIKRSANRNGTARIYGKTALKDWFQAHYQLGEMVEVDLSSPDKIAIGGRWPCPRVSL